MAETHISIVFFVGERAYKLKKPVRFPFADLRTRKAREHLCHREVELNRRLAPDVYLGVTDLLDPDGEPCDHLVVMRRMPSERRLSTLIIAEDPSLPRILADVGGLLARFHRDAPRSPVIDDEASAVRVAQRWQDNFDEMRPFVGDLLDAGVFAQTEKLAGDFIAGRRRLFAQRVESGFACDGHGDLQADDVFCLDDGPRVLDCIEFCDELRYGDVVNDLAFLVMDLERLGAAALTEDLIGAYEQEADTTIPRSLLHFYVGYRAQVRAKVACLRAAQLAPDDPEGREVRARAANLLGLCVQALGDALPRLVLVGGLPGTGKTTVATGIARTLGIEAVRSDVVRKELAGLDPSRPAVAPFRQGIYDPALTARVYSELLDRAQGELAQGRSVVLDASFTHGSERARARALATEMHGAIVELRCTLDGAAAARRMEVRRTRSADASDADGAIAEAMAEIADPWPEATVLPTRNGAHVVLARALREVIHQPIPSGAVSMTALEPPPSRSRGSRPS